MPDCQYAQQISLLLDGELDPSDALRMEKHLQTCAECAARYRAFSDLSSLLQDFTAEPPEGFTESVMAQILAEEKIVPITEAKKRKKRSALAPMLTTAACLAVIIGVMAVGGHDLPTKTSLVLNRNQTVDTAQIERAAADESADAAGSALNDSIESDSLEDVGSFASVLDIRDEALDEETTAEIRALLKDGVTTNAPDADEEPLCILTGQKEDTLLWLDDVDVIYTEDGAHFYRIEGLADTVKELLNLD